MISHTVIITALLCFITTSSAALVLTSTATTPSIVRLHDQPVETFVPSDTITLGRATATTSATATSTFVAELNRRPFAVPEPENTAEIVGLGSIVPLLAVSVAVAAIAFRLYQDRCEKQERMAERKAAEEKAPEEFIRHATPVELEARELGRERYSPT